MGRESTTQRKSQVPLWCLLPNIGMKYPKMALSSSSSSASTTRNRDAEVDEGIPPSIFLNHFSLFLSHTHCISMISHSVVQTGTLVGPVWTAAMLTAFLTPSHLSARLGDTAWRHRQAHPGSTLGLWWRNAIVCRNHRENQARQTGEPWVW